MWLTTSSSVSASEFWVDGFAELFAVVVTDDVGVEAEVAVDAACTLKVRAPWLLRPLGRRGMMRVATQRKLATREESSTFDGFFRFK